MDRAILVARNDNRLQPDPARYIVTRLGSLTFMSDVYPVAIPDLLQLFLEDGGVIIDSPAHAIVPDEFVIVSRVGNHGRHVTVLRDSFRSFSDRAGSRNGSRSSCRVEASAESSRGSRKTQHPLRASRIISRGPLPRSSRPTSTAANSLASQRTVSPVSLLIAIAKSETSSWASVHRC